MSQTEKRDKNREKPDGFRAKKALGQNFLTDEAAIRGIVRGSGLSAGETVLEIGPGKGALTVLEAKTAEKVIAVELDRDVIPILEKNLKKEGCDNVEILNKDILETDLGEILGKDAERTRVIGNLPYYITTPIIMKLLESHLPLKSVTIMMQKEVADRVEAEPGSKDYGVLSVSVQYYAEVTRILDVDRTSFDPSPNVDSAVLRLDLRKEPLVKPLSETDYFRVVKAAFSQRRKTISNSLMTLGLGKEAVNGLLKAAGIEPVRRAETVSLTEYGALADAYTKSLRKE